MNHCWKNVCRVKYYKCYYVKILQKMRFYCLCFQSSIEWSNFLEHIILGMYNNTFFQCLEIIYYRFYNNVVINIFY